MPKLPSWEELLKQIEALEKEAYDQLVGIIEQKHDLKNKIMEESYATPEKK